MLRFKNTSHALTYGEIIAGSDKAITFLAECYRRAYSEFLFMDFILNQIKPTHERLQGLCNKATECQLLREALEHALETKERIDYIKRKHPETIQA